MTKEEYITDGNGNSELISTEIIVISQDLINQEILSKEQQLLSMYDEILKLKEQKNNNINGTN
jgi:hypothetical protein